MPPFSRFVHTMMLNIWQMCFKNVSNSFDTTQFLLIAALPNIMVNTHKG